MNGRDRSPFSLWLQAALDSSGVSLYALSRRTGVCYTQLDRILRSERGTTPETVRKIAAALGVSAESGLLALSASRGAKIPADG